MINFQHIKHHSHTHKKSSSVYKPKSYIKITDSSMYQRKSNFINSSLRRDPNEPF
jgi:hypothetical protein